MGPTGQTDSCVLPPRVQRATTVLESHPLMSQAADLNRGRRGIIGGDGPGPLCSPILVAVRYRPGGPAASERTVMCSPR